MGANTTSSGNVAIGDDAMVVYTGPGGAAGGNTAVGGGAFNALLTGVLNTALGIGAGNNYTGGESTNVIIGANCAGIAGDINTIRIADSTAGTFAATSCFIGGIVGAPNFVDTVKINPATGQLGDQPSSARFKKDIAPMDKSSEAIFSLKPVTFHYKNDKTNTACFGLIAEEVARANPALIAVDKEGKPYTVAYDKINAMLLNEFLKEHSTVQELKQEVAALVATVKEQAAQIQKVSAQLELNKPAPQTVLNNR